MNARSDTNLERQINDDANISFINIGQRLSDDFGPDSLAPIQSNSISQSFNSDDKDPKDSNSVKNEEAKQEHGEEQTEPNDNNGQIRSISRKQSVHLGPDWILSAGVDLGITQISRYRLDETTQSRRFTWNHPISITYKSYNFYGWPQIVLSVYCFDSFGNDQIVGYGVAHLPICSRDKNVSKKHLVHIHAPQSSSFTKLIASWLTGRKPELVNPETLASGDCRSPLHMSLVGEVELSLDLMTRDVAHNNYTT